MGLELTVNRVIECNANDNLELRDALLEVAEALDRLAHRVDVIDKRLDEVAER